MSKSTSSNTFSPRELEVLAGGMRCTKSSIAVDYAKLAEICNFEKVGSAKGAWNGLMRKIKAMAENEKGEGSTERADTPTGAGKKRKKSSEADGDDEEATASKPKAKRGRKAKKQDEATEEAEKTDGEDAAGETKSKVEDDEDGTWA